MGASRQIATRQNRQAVAVGHRKGIPSLLKKLLYFVNGFGQGEYHNPISGLNQGISSGDEAFSIPDNTGYYRVLGELEFFHRDVGDPAIAVHDEFEHL